MLTNYLHHPSRGMTFIEVVIATAIAGVVSIGLYASAAYSTRETIRSTENLYALLATSSAAAKVRAGDFNKLGLPINELTSSDFEYEFAANKTLTADPVHPASNKTTFTLEHRFKGFGRINQVSGTNGSQIRITNAPGTTAWQANEFQGHVLVISSGTGVNQVSLIRSHAATSNGQTVIQVSSDLTGQNATPGWASLPDTTSEVLVDNGKFCELRVTWTRQLGTGTGTRSQTVFIPRSGS